MKKMKIKIFGANVLVKQDKFEEKSEGGIVLLTQTTGKPWSGTVVALGDGHRCGEGYTKSNLKVGNRVHLRHHCGQIMNIDKEEYLLVDIDFDVFLVEEE